MAILTHNKRITSDDSDVFSGSIIGEVPVWAKRLRIQVCASDNDWKFDLNIGGLELARACAPHVTAAVSIDQSGDFRKQHIIYDLPARRPEGFNPLLNVDVVTAGEGVVFAQYES